MTTFKPMRTNDTIYEPRLPGQYYPKNLHDFSRNSNAGYLSQNTYIDEYNSFSKYTKSRHGILRNDYKSYPMDLTSLALSTWTQTQYV